MQCEYETPSLEDSYYEEGVAQHEMPAEDIYYDEYEAQQPQTDFYGTQGQMP